MEYLAVIILIVFVICFMGYRIKYNRERFSAPKMSMYDYPFETGDLVLADGTGYVPAFTPSSVDHAAIVYREPKTGQLFLWHAANDFLYAFQPLFRVLEKYKLVFVRKLHGRRQLLRPWDRSYQQLLQKENLTFDIEIYFPALAQNMPVLLGSAIPQRSRPPKTIFCTALALQTYIHLGVFPPAMLQQKDHLWLTSDLCSWSKTFPLPFLNGFSFGPETRLLC